MDDPTPTAYSQWATITIHNLSSSAPTLIFKNVKLKYEKFYRNENKADEVYPDEIAQAVIPSGSYYTVETCGRETSPTGTEGSFEIWTRSGSELVRGIYWDCPWTNVRNTFTSAGGSERWTQFQTGGNPENGALGNIVLNLIYSP